MAKYYEISEYFSKEALRQAANASYKNDKEGSSELCDPRDIYGYCPLGIALLMDHGKDIPENDLIYRTPITSNIERFVGRDEYLPDRVSSFTADWDRGRINDLYAAFGLTRKGN